MSAVPLFAGSKGVVVRKHRIFVLGAGFSYRAGLPLGDELWKEVRLRASRLRGRAERFNDDLATYLRYLRECDGREVKPEDIQFEDFLAFLDIEHHLGLAGRDEWSHEGNESQVLVKWLIGQILVERTPSADALPQLYYDFATELTPGDWVLTFNNDTILEAALEHVGRGYRLFQSRNTSTVHPYPKEQEVVVLKLHGSVDWFDKAGYSQSEVSYSEPGCRPHPVFGNAKVKVKPLLEGSQCDKNPLHTVHRVVKGLETVYTVSPFLGAVPCLLNPSKSKALYADRFKDFWQGMGRGGGSNLGVIIVGYSLPQHDDYAKQALFRMLRNYQDTSWDESQLGERKKSPVLLVDKQDEAHGREFLAHFGFIDADKVRTHFAGFDEDALALIRDI